MTIGRWCAQQRGRARALATHLGVTEAAVSHWCHGRHGPAGRYLLAIVEFTKGAVSIEEMLK